jgi:hypothetical protein
VLKKYFSGSHSSSLKVTKLPKTLFNFFTLSLFMLESPWSGIHLTKSFLIFREQSRMTTIASYIPGNTGLYYPDNTLYHYDINKQEK